MNLLNFSPFPNIHFYQSDQSGQEFGVLVVKGTYEIDKVGRMRIAREQAPILLQDLYFSEDVPSSLWLPSDLTPAKPKSDIVVCAVARSPGGAPCRTWTCGIRVSGQHVLEKQLRVYGPRCWMPQWSDLTSLVGSNAGKGSRKGFRGWTLSEAQAVTEVPIRYELAYGGCLIRCDPTSGEELCQADERNPVGCGWIDNATTPKDLPIQAAQIESDNDPIREPGHSYRPESLGPIPPAWLPRRPLGGTFDKHWLENVWPKWPADYDFAYHNCAHPDLIYPGMLQGDEVVELLGLQHSPQVRVIKLPGDTMEWTRVSSDRTISTYPMALDTLVFDVADQSENEHRAFLVWRVNFETENLLGASARLKQAATLQHLRTDADIVAQGG